MVRLLRKIPRPLFIVNYYAYPIMAALVVLVSAAVLNSNGVSLLGLGVPVLVVLVFSLIWWRLHARQSADLPTTANDSLPEIWRSQPYTLLAFESEYCPVCMTMARQVSRLEVMPLDSLKIYKVSVNKDPGRNWFEMFDGRATPTYVLLNSEGQVVMDWSLVLPVERILYAVTNNLRQL